MLILLSASNQFAGWCFRTPSGTFICTDLNFKPENGFDEAWLKPLVYDNEFEAYANLDFWLNGKEPVFLGDFKNEADADKAMENDFYEDV